MVDDVTPDSTKELLTFYHAAILRELDLTSRAVRADISDLRHDLHGTRTRLDAHDADDAKRFGSIDRGLSVLQWAYGVGVVVVTALLAKMGWGG